MFPPETDPKSPATSGSSSAPSSEDASAGSEPLIAVAGTEYGLAWSPDVGASPVDAVIVDGSGVGTRLLTGIDDSGSAIVQFPLLAPSVDPLDLEVRDPSSGTHRLDVGVRPAALAELVWNEATHLEEYRWLDPATGHTALRGTVGDLQGYGSAAFDAALHRVYVVGSSDDVTADLKLSTLDARSGQLLNTAPLDRTGIAPFVLNGPGSALGFVISAAGLIVLQVDPSTGTTTPLSTLSASANWTADASIDLAQHRVYLVGYPADPDDLATLFTPHAQLARNAGHPDAPTRTRGTWRPAAWIGDPWKVSNASVAMAIRRDTSSPLRCYLKRWCS